jgi:hypothetical protein
MADNIGGEQIFRDGRHNKRNIYHFLMGHPKEI